MEKKPKAPSHLSTASRAWFSRVIGDYVLSEHHVKLLTLAAESWDRCCEARRIVAAQGLTVPTEGGGCKAHPCIAIERDSRIAFARLIRELDLDADTPSAYHRPPALRSNRGRI
jgi:phage terminase small subunit